jgi:hypothetical protein
MKTITLNCKLLLKENENIPLISSLYVYDENNCMNKHVDNINRQLHEIIIQKHNTSLINDTISMKQSLESMQQELQKEKQLRNNSEQLLLKLEQNENERIESILTEKHQIILLENKLMIKDMENENKILQMKIKDNIKYHHELENKIQQMNEIILNKITNIEKNTQRTSLSIAELGIIGEEYVMKILNNFYRYDTNITYTNCAKKPNCGDIFLQINEKYTGCIDVKNYKNSNIIPQKEIQKLMKDVDMNQYNFGILATLYDNKFFDNIKIFDIIYTPNQNLIILINNLNKFPDFLPVAIKMIIVELKKINTNLNDVQKINKYELILKNIVKFTNLNIKHIKNTEKNVAKLYTNLSKQLNELQSVIVL